MKKWWLILGICLIRLHSVAQTEDRWFSTIGTSWQDAHGRDWAWLTFMTTDADDLKDRSLAVFAKSGKFDSGNTYELQSIVELQSSPLLIGVLIERATNLGGNADELRADIEAVFRGFDLDPALSDGEKVAAIMQGSVGDKEDFANLMLLARKHPALALATGIAYAAPIGNGFTSFEIREWDATLGEAGAVLGRVRVEAGTPRSLPAPVNVVPVLEDSPRANLNTRFRWEEPDSLKRLSLLQFGFDIYRMTDVFAEAQGYADTPADPDAIAALLLNHPDDVVKVNRYPVLIPGEDDGTIPFFIDDNTTVGDGTVPLVDGESYYYFVAARDILGRPGELSDGLKLMVCDKYPPTPPRDIRVEREQEFNEVTGEREQYLRVRWRQIQNDEISEYHIYRWNSTTDPGFRWDDPNHPNAPIATITHKDGEVFNEYVDESLDEEDQNVSFMYTIRALDKSACGPNVSGHSGMGIGSTADFENPDRPVIETNILCLQITAIKNDVTDDPLGLNDHPYVVAATRSLDLDHVNWVEVRWAPVDQDTPEAFESSEWIGRFYYQEEEDLKMIRIPAPGDVPVTVYVRYGKGMYKTSNWVSGMFNKSDPTIQAVFHFEAEEHYVMQAPDEECLVHEFPPPVDDPEDPDYGVIDELPTTDLLTEDSGFEPGQEWRIFQQTNNEDPVLIAQGVVYEDTAAIIEDAATALRTVSCARIRFYVQSVSTDGMVGSLIKSDDFYMGIRTPPKPILNAPRSTGNFDKPAVQVRWVLSPYGVEDFMVYVGMATQPPQEISSDLSVNQLPPNTRVTFKVNGEDVTLLAGAYMTQRVGSGFGKPGEGQFELTLPVEIGEQMTLSVNARTRCGESGFSDAVQFQWMGAETQGPEVPWPARPLPELADASDYPLLESVWLPENDQTIPYALNQLGIRVGRFPWKETYVGQSPGKGSEFRFEIDATFVETFLLEGLYEASPLIPFMVYRRQVPSDSFPDVSGDVVQVSPLIEQISSQFEAPGTLILRDPFFVALPELGNDNPVFGDLYFKDTQPVIRGAAYQHYMVLFNDRYEPYRVIPLDVVEVPK
ncbi:hypothetical protein P0Y35_03835 [Kiritimatiellaeota bacterium B1221]|nr:hypothetical protein [Kiritimatiellaeota bacterium B1221]